jgi:hypothetical protein
MLQYFLNRVNLTTTFIKLLMVMLVSPLMFRELGHDTAQLVLIGTIAYVIFQTFFKIKRSIDLASHPESKDLTVVAYSPMGFDPMSYDASIGPKNENVPPIYRERFWQRRLFWSDKEELDEIYNGRKLALCSFKIRESYGKRPSLTLGFAENDYVTQRAASDVYSELDEDSKSKVLKHYRYSPSKFFSRSFGVSLCVITADNQLVLVRRSNKVAVNANKITCAVSEGMDFEDVRFGRPCIFKNAIRGIKEELGIILDDSTECVRITALAINEERYEWLAMGYVDFRDVEGGKYTSEYIAKNWKNGVSLDADEMKEMFFIPFNREDVATYLDSHKKDLVNYTHTVVAHTLNDLIPVSGGRR